MLLSQALGRNTDRLPVIYSQGAVKLLLCAQWSPHTSIPSTRHERHWSNMENSETLVSHPLSLPHSSSSHPAPLLHHVCSSPQAQNRRNRRRFAFHDHRPPQQTGANRRVVRNSLLQPKKQLKTCYFKSFIQTVLKMVIFKASWPLCAGGQADLPWSSSVPCTTEQPRKGHVDPKLPYTNWFTPRLRGAKSRAHTQLIHDAIQILPANSLWKPSNCNKWTRLILLIDTWLNQLSISTLISTA